MPWTVAMIAKAIPVAIRQYSIAVAPDSIVQEFQNQPLHPQLLSLA